MLSRDFLAQMAIAHELTPEQEEVFLLRFGDGKSYEDIAAQLHTSPGACLKRMGQVYTKFNVPGESRGKENRLRIWLNQQQRATPPENSPVQQPPVATTATGSEAIALDSTTTTTSPSASTIPDDYELIGGEVSVSTAIPVRHNLPMRDYSLVGRKQELAHLLDLLAANDYSTRLISVFGIGGVGKTTLVLEAAYHCLETSTRSDSALPHSFGAIIFTSAKHQYLTTLGILPRFREEGERTLRDILRAIAHTLACEIRVSSDSEQRDRIRAALKQQRTLLIIDNLETVEDKQDVLSFVYTLPPNVKIVFTSREQVSLVQIQLDTLPEADGLALIRQASQEQGIPPLGEDAALQLYQSTSGIPAAITYTLGQLRAGYELTDILLKLRTDQGDIARFCFQESIKPLKGHPSYCLLMALAIFPHAPSRSVLAEVALSESDAITVGEGLVQLQQRSLIWLYQGRYFLLSLTRGYALAELAMHPEVEQQIRDRWVDTYLRISESFGKKDWKEWHPPDPDLEVEWENLTAVLEWCIATHRYAPVRSLWQQVKGYAQVRGYWDDRLAWSKWLLQAANAANDWATVVEAMTDRAWTLTLMGQPQCLEEAERLLQEAWALRTHQPPLQHLEIANHLAVLSIRQSQFKQAQRWLTEEKTLLEQIELSPQQKERHSIQVQYYEAEICFRSGKYAQARKLYQQVLKQAKAAGWQRAVVATQNWLADAALQQGDLAEAQDLLHQGLDHAKQYQDKRSIAFHHKSLAQLSYQRHQWDEAQQWAIAALEGFENLRMIPEAEETRELLNQIADNLRKPVRIMD